MTAVRPYYLLGQQQLDRLAEPVRAALAALTKRWWPADCTLQLVGISNVYSSADLPGTPARYYLQSGDRWLALFGSERDWLALAEGWLGCKVAAASELVQTLLRAFCCDIFCALAESSEEPELRADVQCSQLPRGMLQPGAGTLLLEISIAGAAFKILASPTLWPDLAKPAAAHSKKKLAPCSAALGACRVQISAVLPMAQIPLTDIAVLAVGDFLNLGHDLSGSVQLHGNNIQLSLPATVGRRHARKAIKLTAIQQEKTV